jgi:hypothetical protein
VIAIGGWRAAIKVDPNPFCRTQRRERKSCMTTALRDDSTKNPGHDDRGWSWNVE